MRNEILQQMTNQIPKNQKNDCNGNIGNQGRCTDGNNGVSAVFQHKENATEDCAGENSFAQLFANNIGEEEGIHGPQKGIGNGNNHTEDQTDKAGEKHQCQKNQQNLRCVGDDKMAGYKTPAATGMPKTL